MLSNWKTLAIPPINQSAMEAAKRKVDLLVKPLGSLGRLEEIAIQLAGIHGEIPQTLDKRRIVVFAADNGLWATGVSPVPQDVTLKQAINMTRGKTGVCALARFAGCELVVVDIGINADITPGVLIDNKLAKGTADFTLGPAMSREDASHGLDVGVKLATSAARERINLLAAGEMGICNTSTSAAVLSALTGMPANDTVGKGAGLSQAQFSLKREVVARALEVNKPDLDDPLDVLAKVGGFDIAGMAGLFIGGAAERLPMVVDGFIAMVAALIAVRLRPEVRPYLFASHISRELGFTRAARELALTPVLDMQMRLGEGSGCPLMMLVMESALRMAHEMGTFEEAAIDIGDYVDLRAE